MRRPLSGPAGRRSCERGGDPMNNLFGVLGVVILVLLILLILRAMAVL